MVTTDRNLELLGNYLNFDITNIPSFAQTLIEMILFKELIYPVF